MTIKKLLDTEGKSRTFFTVEKLNGQIPFVVDTKGNTFCIFEQTQETVTFELISNIEKSNNSLVINTRN